MKSKLAGADLQAQVRALCPPVAGAVVAAAARAPPTPTTTATITTSATAATSPNRSNSTSDERTLKGHLTGAEIHIQTSSPERAGARKTLPSSSRLSASRLTGNHSRCFVSAAAAAPQTCLCAGGRASVASLFTSCFLFNSSSRPALDSSGLSRSLSLFAVDSRSRFARLASRSRRRPDSKATGGTPRGSRPAARGRAQFSGTFALTSPAESGAANGRRK